MPATATITAGLTLAVPAPTGTANQTQQRIPADAALTAQTNTIAQIAVHVTDGLAGDDQTMELRLMPAAAAVTADTATDKINLTGHVLTAGQAVQCTGSPLPSPLAAGTLYYVRDVGANDFRLAATVGGAAINLTTTGASVKVRAFGAVTIAHLYEAPGTPVRIIEQVTGEVNDFTQIRAAQIIFRPLDAAADARGRAQLTMGDPAARYDHFSVPLHLDHAGGAVPVCPSWLATLPQGLPYSTDYHLTLRIAATEGNINGLILINLLGN